MRFLVAADSWVQYHIRLVTFLCVLVAAAFWIVGPWDVPGWSVPILAALSGWLLSVVAIIGPLGLLTWPAHRGEEPWLGR